MREFSLAIEELDHALNSTGNLLVCWRSDTSYTLYNHEPPPAKVEQGCLLASWRHPGRLRHDFFCRSRNLIGCLWSPLSLPAGTGVRLHSYCLSSSTMSLVHALCRPFEGPEKFLSFTKY